MNIKKVGGGGGQPVPFATSHIIGREEKRTSNKTMGLDTVLTSSIHYAANFTCVIIYRCVCVTLGSSTLFR